MSTSASWNDDTDRLPTKPAVNLINSGMRRFGTEAAARGYGGVCSESGSEDRANTAGKASLMHCTLGLHARVRSEGGRRWGQTDWFYRDVNERSALTEDDE